MKFIPCRMMVLVFLLGVNGVGRSRIARLNANGSLDAGFNP